MTMKLPRLPNPAVARGHYQHMYLGSLYTADQVKAYAQKCIAQEREDCAKVCEEWGAWNQVAQDCAAAIRERKDQ